ncbi:MAG: gluconate 2-dehydrogenase subunit 3 family protein [Polyangia bacterium]
MAKPGYYPGFSTLSQKEHWDGTTRALIEKRMASAGPLNFFSAVEAATMQAILDCLIPQTDRDELHQIPVLHAVDDRLHEKRFDGYIYEGTLPEDESYRLGLSCIERVSQARHRKPFSELDIASREDILIGLRDETLGSDWHGGRSLPAPHFWSLLLQDAISAYYAHPFAWDEIGFGGPAYPRGYMRRVDGRPEPWEKDEVRYEWLAPEGSQSDSYKANEELYSKSGHHGDEGSF